MGLGQLSDTSRRNRPIERTMATTFDWVKQTRRPHHDPEALKAAFRRHIDSAPYTHGGLPNANCPACADLKARMEQCQ